MKNQTSKAVVIVFLGVLGVSTSAIFGRMITAGGLITALYRMIATVLLLAPAALLRHREELRSLPKKSLLACTVSGIFLGGHFGAYLSSVKMTSIASCLVLVDTEVLFVALALRLLYGKRLKNRERLGIIAALAGSAVVALADSGSGGGSRVLLGDALAVLAALFSAVYTLIGVKQRETLSTTAYTFIVYSAAALTLLVTALLSGQPLTGYPPKDLLLCAAMAVCCSLLGHSLFSYSLKYVSPAFVSMAKLGEPVFTSLLAVLIFAEIPGLMQLLGGLAVLGGIALYLTKSKEKEQEA